jgi:hypothetical protein
MGGTCSPSQGDTQHEIEEDVEATLERQDSSAGENLTKLIANYQTENEKLKRELEEHKSRDQNDAADNEEKARQNEEVISELAAMKELLEAKDRALVRGRLEAALRSKATTLRSIESKTRLCIEGKLLHHYRSGLTKSKKEKHVELFLTEGELEINNYNAGYVMLTYADSKGAQTAKRCEVVGVVEESKTQEMTFALTVRSGGSTKELVFTCETVEQRAEWVKCVGNALEEIRTTYEEMHQEFTVKLQITKEKLGIRIQEIVVDQVEIDEKAKDVPDKLEGTMTKAAREIEIEQKKALGFSEKVVKELEQANVKAVEKDEQMEEQKKQEKPCELVVAKIYDEDHIKGGLHVNCVMRAINDIPLVGMVYSEQIELLKNTPKPYIITFTGKNLLKKKSIPTHAYFSIFKELVADGENPVKTAFNELVKGSQFEKELKSSDDQVATITALLSDQRRLMALLQNLPVQEMEL